MLDKAQQLAEARNHKLLPFVRRGPSSASRCVTCARQVYICLNPGLNGAAIGGDAIAEVCIRKTERLCEGILKLEDRHHSAETSVIAITS